MSRVFKRGLASVSANLTPMIDVTFLLIVFFVLVSQIVEFEKEKDIQLPHPETPLTEPITDEQRVMVNVLPAPGRSGEIRGYRVGLAEFNADDAGRRAMTEHLTTVYRTNPSIYVNLRADRNTEYQWVEPVMGAMIEASKRAADIGAKPRLNLVVIRDR